MTIHKLTAPNDTTKIIGDYTVRSPLWLVLGVAYTDSDPVANWARRKGYAVNEVDEIPAEHLEQCARLNAYPVKPLGFTGDGANPEQKYMFNAADGHTAVDIRDVINGTITA